MSIPGAASPLFIGAAAEAGPFQIDRSLRITKGDQAYLNRTPSSAGNRKTFTLSFWIKRTIPVANFSPTTASIFSASAGGSSWFDIGFYTVDELQVITDAGVSDTGVRTQAIHRDFSSWYHFVIAVDTTNSTANDRIIVYANGTRQDVTIPSGMPSQNSDTLVNATNAHYFGRDGRSSNVRYGDNYFAEIHFVDGQALAPTAFGETDDNNNWNPKAYDGTYGTNGFHLDFSDNSSNSALGTDAAGSNDWTVNNLTASVSNPSYDSTHGSNITSTEAAKIFDSDDSTYGVATGDFIGFAYGGSSVKMKVENTKSSQVSFYIQPNVSNNAVNSGTWGSQSAGTVSSNQWYIPASTTATAIFTFPATWDGDGRIYASGNEANLRFYSMDATAADIAGIDSLIDTPTNYTADSGNNGGNYATLNPLAIRVNGGTMSNGNLTLSASGSQYIEGKSTLEVLKFNNYCELTITGGDSNTDGGFGIGDHDAWVAGGAGSYITYRESGAIISYPGNTTVATVNGWTQGDVLGMAVDSTNIKFYKNGSLQGTYSHSKSGTFFAHVLNLASNSNAVMDINFGQRSFAYTPPTGYLPLVTTSLPDPTIADGSTVMQTKLWDGDGSSTRTISGYNHSPDFVWIKNRSLTGWQHVLYDQIRGGGTGSVTKSLSTDSTRSEASGNDTNHGYLSGFTSDGFSLVKGSQSGGDYVNHSGNAYVGWSWDAGTSTATNNDGSIAASVRVNQSAGFSIVTYTGTGSNATVGHGLNAAPYWVVVKRRDSAGSWIVWHNAFGAASNTDYLYLNGQIAIGGDGSNAFWNSTVPTNSVFSVGTGGSVNASNATYVAYCWAPVAGYSSFGQYTGNGSSDGTFVYTGHRSRFLLIKADIAGEDWVVIDTERETYNTIDSVLFANDATAEITNSAYNTDILSNGFKLRGTNPRFNTSGETYVFASFAEHPFKTARAR